MSRSKSVGGKEVLAAMSELDDRYIMEAITYKSAGIRKLKRGLLVAAVFVLCLTGGIHVGLRYDHFLAGCSAYPGQIIDGVYYYHVQHEGVYSYMPGSNPQKLLSTFRYDSYLVNDYGIYYKDGRRIYVQEHETGERRRLYWANPFLYTHIGFSLQQDGNVIVTLYNKHKEIVREVLLDGRTGEVLETVMEATYDEAALVYYSNTHFQVGSREIVLMEENGDFTVTEKGQPIGAGEISLLTVSRWSAEYIGDSLWFRIVEETDEMENDGIMPMLVIYPDGGAERKEICPLFGVVSGNHDYLFWNLNSSNTMWCYDVKAEESWELTVDNDMTIYDLETDGKYLYSCVPWGDFQALWEIVYDEAGKPIAMHLLDENIRK